MIFLNDIIPINVNWQKNVNGVQQIYIIYTLYTYIFILYKPRRVLYPTHTRIEYIGIIYACTA
jgi:hypothetical protein